MQKLGNSRGFRIQMQIKKPVLLARHKTIFNMGMVSIIFAIWEFNFNWIFYDFFLFCYFDIWRWYFGEGKNYLKSYVVMMLLLEKFQNVKKPSWKARLIRALNFPNNYQPANAKYGKDFPRGNMGLGFQILAFNII